MFLNACFRAGPTPQRGRQKASRPVPKDDLARKSAAAKPTTSVTKGLSPNIFIFAAASPEVFIVALSEGGN